MHRTIWSSASLVGIMALALLGRVEAQQHQQHHRGGAQASQERTDEETQEMPAQTPMGQPMQGMMQQMQGMMQQMQGMMQQMHGRMGRGGMRGRGMRMEQDDGEPSEGRGMRGHGMRGHGMRGRGMRMSHRGMMRHTQRQLERLTQQLDLSDEQQTKVQALMRTRAKEAIRLQADIDTAGIDLQQLLDAQPVDTARVKTTLQTIAGKEADIRFLHITAMQGIRALLTPEQQKQFRAVWGGMMGHGGKMRHRGMMGHRGMRKHGKQMGRGGMHGPGRMTNPCGMQR